MPGASFAQHGHVDQSTDVPVPQRQGGVHLRGRERLRLVDQSRHLLYEFAALGADRLRDGPERSQVRARATRWCATAPGLISTARHDLILVLVEVERLL